MGGGFFVSHTLVDAEYCRQLILPAIEAMVHRGFNQYVFMDYENFGSLHVDDGPNPWATAYAREIERLLDDSQALILVASLAAARSEWVKYKVGVKVWAIRKKLEKDLNLDETAPGTTIVQAFWIAVKGRVDGTDRATRYYVVRCGAVAGVVETRTLKKPRKYASFPYAASR